jgi:hypothetical protein
VLTTLNYVKLGNLTNIRSIDTGFLTTRAWDTLRAVVQGVAPAKAAATVPTVPLPDPGHTPMLRGAERC